MEALLSKNIYDRWHPYLLLCWVRLPEVWYCAESISSQYHTRGNHHSCDLYISCLKISPSFFWINFVQYHTALSQSPRSMLLRWVDLPAVSYCGESSHFLRLLHMPLKGQWHKNKCGFFFSEKGLNFVFLQKSSRIKFFSIVHTKIRHVTQVFNFTFF